MAPTGTSSNDDQGTPLSAERDAASPHHARNTSLTIVSVKEA